MSALLTPLFLCMIAWGADPSSFVSPGELAEAHHEVSGISQCTACHSLGVGVSPEKCLVCHERVQEQVQSKVGFHSDKGEDCASCHPDHRGRSFEMVTLEEEGFDHSITGFELEGAHFRAACEDCHTGTGWTDLQATCSSCHDEPHGAENSTRDVLGTCASCHGVEDWDALPLLASVFDHTDPADTDYLLAGQHLEVGCEDCHDAWHFVPTDGEPCAACHDDLHGGQFDPRPCEDCHTVEIAAFALRDYDHDTTDYPLRGQHREVKCEDCHGDREDAHYVDLPHARCDTCHADVHNGQFAPRDCDACHSLALAGFAMPEIDHDETAFPLHGAHADVLCADCHGEGPDAVFAGLPFDDCATCHEDPHEKRFDPDRCDSCHLDGTWEVASFDHERTRYPLTGAHTEVPCADCHGVEGEEIYAPLPFGSCLDCHGDDEPHQGGFAAGDCVDCHVTAEWKQVSYAHFEATQFALADGHALPCADCHDQPAFDGQQAACESCHPRPEAHFEGPCEECHLPTDWRAGTLGDQGHGITGFPLHGVHGQIGCVDCHLPGRAAHEASRECVDCHRGEDTHRNLLGNTCGDCHRPADWGRTHFAHAATGFPLRGNHRLAMCMDCHATGYAGTPRDCWRCHQTEQPASPPHSGATRTSCGSCHRPYTWDSATFSFGGR